MPGWMGLRDIKPSNPHEQERLRQESQRLTAHKKETQVQQRSQEKVREILREQGGDLSAYAGLSGYEVPNGCNYITALPVRAIMSRRVAVISFDDTLLTIQGIFARVRFHHLPVVGPNEEVIGIISDRDFLRAVSPFLGTVNEQTRDKEIMSRKAGLIMTRNPICLEENANLLTAVKLMNSRKISCLPIVHLGTTRLAGIVTWKDVVRAFCQQAFAPDHDSKRLKDGVSIDSAKTESQRLKARAEAASHAPEGAVGQSHATADSVDTTDSSDSHPMSPDHHPISLEHQAPHIAAQEKLSPSHVGQSGSDLASRQMARMRRQYGAKDGKEGE